MTALVLDTAGLRGGVALARGGEILASREWSDPRAQSDLLWPSIRALLAERSLTLADLEGVIVCHGPGRLTGVRIGLTVAKTLCAERAIPLALVSVFEQCAEGWRGAANQRLVVISGRAGPRRGFQIFERRGETVVAVGEPITVDGDSLLSRVTDALGSAKPRFLGPGVEDLATEFETAWPDSVIESPEPSSLARLATAGHRKLHADETADPRAACPLYL